MRKNRSMGINQAPKTTKPQLTAARQKTWKEKKKKRRELRMERLDVVEVLSDEDGAQVLKKEHPATLADWRCIHGTKQKKQVEVIELHLQSNRVMGTYGNWQIPRPNR